MPEDKDKKKVYIRRTVAVATLIIALLGSITFMEKFLCIPASQEMDQNRVLMLHKEPKNTIDVLLIGSSATYSGFSSAYAYEKYGFTSWPYAIGGSTCTMWKPALQDALRTQRPKLVVVDVFGGGYERDMIETRSSQLYVVMNSVPFSVEKIRTAREISRNVNNVSAASMVFPFIKCHSRVPINILNLKSRLAVEKSGPSPLKGIETLTRKRKLKPVVDSAFSDESLPLDPETERVIRDFIDYCKSEDLDVVFVKYPIVLKVTAPDELVVNQKANRILEIAEESGYSAFNMQKYFHEIGLVECDDYYNHGHTNTRGQRKVTEFLGNYIQNTMNIGPSELSEDVRKEWDESVIYYDAFCKLSEELINRGYDLTLGNSPETAHFIERIINGEDAGDVAESYADSYKDKK